MHRLRAHYGFVIDHSRRGMLWELTLALTPDPDPDPDPSPDPDPDPNT